MASKRSQDSIDDRLAGSESSGGIGAFLKEAANIALVTAAFPYFIPGYIHAIKGIYRDSDAMEASESYPDTPLPANETAIGVGLGVGIAADIGMLFGYAAAAVNGAPWILIIPIATNLASAAHVLRDDAASRREDSGYKVSRYIDDAHSCPNPMARRFGGPGTH